MKFIATNHPVDPLTKKNFNLWDRITVKDYCTKLFDPCGCYRLRYPIIDLIKYVRKKQRGEKQQQRIKP